MWLIIGAAAVAWFIKNSWLYLVGWFLSIAVSLAAGMTLQNFISTLGIVQDDERFTGYLTGSNTAGEITTASMSFRWDFIAFSGIGIGF